MVFKRQHPRGGYHAYCPWDGTRYTSEEVVCGVCGADRGKGGPYPARGLPSFPQPVDSTLPDTSLRPKWQRKLYLRQPYPDNYVDPGFLVGLVTNKNLQTYSLGELVFQSTAISQQLTFVVFFLICTYSLLLDRLSASDLLGAESGLFLLLCLFELVFKPAEERRQSLSSLFALVLVALCSTPVLATLTRPVSDDTILAAAVCLLLAHLACTDYGFLLGMRPTLSSPVALNAAIFASVVLASRMKDVSQVLALVLLAMFNYALFPLVRQRLLIYSSRAHVCFCVATTACAIGLLARWSAFLCVGYAGSVLFLTVICPFLLIWFQPIKNEINGPWDEAVPLLDE